MRDLRKKINILKVKNKFDLFMCCQNNYGGQFINCPPCVSVNVCKKNNFCNNCGLRLIKSDGRRGSIYRSLLDDDQINEEDSNYCFTELNSDVIIERIVSIDMDDLRLNNHIVQIKDRNTIIDKESGIEDVDKLNK